MAKTDDDALVLEYDSMEADEFEWDSFTEILSQIMEDITSEYKHSDIFHISGSGIGWRNKSSERIFQLDNGRELVRKITPDRSFRVEVRRYTDKKLDITVYHHDSPAGELYVVRPVYAGVGDTFNSLGEKAALEEVAG